MDSLFYRKDQKKFSLKAAVRKLLRNRRLMLALIVAVPLLLFIVFGNRGILQRYHLQQQKTELEAKIREAEAETKELQAESKALDSDKKAIEKVAREKYGMMRQGETVYRVNRKK